MRFTCTLLSLYDSRHHHHHVFFLLFCFFFVICRKKLRVARSRAPASLPSHSAYRRLCSSSSLLSHSLYSFFFFFLFWFSFSCCDTHVCGQGPSMQCTMTTRAVSSAVRSKALVAPVPQGLIEQAGTNLPGIPHGNRVCRAYRQWLKLAVLCPPSALCELNEHAQMNERFVIIIRQKFREGSELRDPDQIAVAVQTCERSLTMFRFIAADGARRKFPEAKPRLNLNKMGFLEMGKINYKQMVKEYWNTYVMRKW